MPGLALSGDFGWVVSPSLDLSGSHLLWQVALSPGLSGTLGSEVALVLSLSGSQYWGD